MLLKKMTLFSKRAKNLLTPSLSPTPSLTRLDKTTTRHTPHPGMVRETEAEEMQTGGTGLVEMKEKGIELAEMKKKEIEAEGPEVEEIGAEVKETKLEIVNQTQ